MQEEIDKALAVLRSGGIILYPTDTLWGIGCDATNESAVERIYALKKSVNKKGMIVLLDDIDSVARYFSNVPDVAWDILEVSDKPLTLILPKASGVAANLIAEDKALAVRVPDHEFCKKLIYKLRRPLVSTSANVSGEPAPADFDSIGVEIKKGVDFIVDPHYEGNPTCRPSSIIKIGEGSEIEIIRS